MFLQLFLGLFLNHFTLSSTSNLPTDDYHSRSKRLAVHPSRWEYNLWPGGVVPYDIAPHYTPRERAVILSAMAEFHKVSCIRFRPRRASDKYYLQINKYYNLERCFSYIGRQVVSMFRTREGNVETRMKLDPSCLRFNGRGTVMHELMHILGFYHEHQRDDRDSRIGVHSGHYNYKIYPRATTYYMGRYDITSIMHYNFNGVTVLSRSYFSSEDIRRINVLYECQVSFRPDLSAPRSGKLVSYGDGYCKIGREKILIEIFQTRGAQESSTYFDADYARYLPGDDEDAISRNELRKKYYYHV